MILLLYDADKMLHRPTSVHKTILSIYSPPYYGPIVHQSSLSHTVLPCNTCSALLEPVDGKRWRRYYGVWRLCSSTLRDCVLPWYFMLVLCSIECPLPSCCRHAAVMLCRRDTCCTWFHAPNNTIGATDAIGAATSDECLWLGYQKVTQAIVHPCPPRV